MILVSLIFLILLYNLSKLLLPLFLLKKIQTPQENERHSKFTFFHKMFSQKLKLEIYCRSNQ